MMPVAILCGGRGTRLGALTQSTPKSLVDVGGQPFILHQFDLLRAQGYRDVVLLTGHLGERIRAVLGNGRAVGMRLRYVHDGPTLRGTAGAITYALPRLGARFFTLYGDAYLACDYQAIERTFLASGKAALVTEWHGVDYGLSAFHRGVFLDHPDLTTLPVLHGVLGATKHLFRLAMPVGFREMGSPEGLKELDADLRRTVSR